MPAEIFRWSKDAAENPYFGYLALTDEIIVTGDSMSMLTEACATRKPVHIFGLGVGRTAMRQQEQESAQIISAVTEGRVFERAHVQAFIYRMTMHVGPQRMTRDIRIVHKVLVDNDMAVWLGDPFSQGDSRAVESVKRAVDRVRGLFGLTEGPDVDAKPAIRTTRGELLRTAS